MRSTVKRSLPPLWGLVVVFVVVYASVAMHQRFRDYRKETGAIIAALGLGPDSSVIDMGCGTGGFTTPESVEAVLPQFNFCELDLCLVARIAAPACQLSPPFLVRLSDLDLLGPVQVVFFHERDAHAEARMDQE